MTTERAPIEPHDVHSERLMRHAFEELAKGDRLQASEKAWGAMAHTLKAIAQERNLKYDQHSDARAVLRRVIRDSPHKAFILGGFSTANELHRNFYGDVQDRDDLQEALQLVSASLALLMHEQARWRERRR